MLVADVVTCDPGRPRAVAVLVKAGHVLAVGAESEMRQRAPHAIREHLPGTLVPGCIDPSQGPDQ